MRWDHALEWLRANVTSEPWDSVRQRMIIPLIGPRPDPVEQQLIAGKQPDRLQFYGQTYDSKLLRILGRPWKEAVLLWCHAIYPLSIETIRKTFPEVPQ